MKELTPLFEVGEIVYRKSQADRVELGQLVPLFVVVKITAETIDNEAWTLRYFIRSDGGEVFDAVEVELVSDKDLQLQRRMADNELKKIDPEQPPFVDPYQSPCPSVSPWDYGKVTSDTRILDTTRTLYPLINGTGTDTSGTGDA